MDSGLGREKGKRIRSNFLLLSCSSYGLDYHKAVMEGIIAATEPAHLGVCIPSPNFNENIPSIGGRLEDRPDVGTYEG
jgi:hypothetical protein